MIIREILARVLNSSAVKTDSHEHVPSGWSPDGQNDVCETPFPWPLRTLSEICRHSVDSRLSNNIIINNHKEMLRCIWKTISR